MCLSLFFSLFSVSPILNIFRVNHSHWDFLPVKYLALLQTVLWKKNSLNFMKCSNKMDDFYPPCRNLDRLRELHGIEILHTCVKQVK